MQFRRRRRRLVPDPFRTLDSGYLTRSLAAVSVAAALSDIGGEEGNAEDIGAPRRRHVPVRGRGRRLACRFQSAPVRRARPLAKCPDNINTCDAVMNHKEGRESGWMIICYYPLDSFNLLIYLRFVKLQMLSMDPCLCQ